MADERPRVPRLTGTVDKGLRDALEVLRDRLAAELDGDAGHRRGCECECGVPADRRIVPAIAKELRDLLTQLDELPAATGRSKLDELTAARLKRRGA